MGAWGGDFSLFLSHLASRLIPEFWDDLKTFWRGKPAEQDAKSLRHKREKKRLREKERVE